MSVAPGHRDGVRQAGGSERLPCIEAYFHGHGYAPHRHDTCAVGSTLAGVRSFRYRGEHRHSLPGQTLQSMLGGRPCRSWP
ncbi:AraC family ligand binding domain-containing protein [Acidovorax sp. PRC11]|uniref:AraC family ligand binding domain-containing protein n=1 Tax=Acidovorax sp. PRC11 TaxID=2962592 RepID=UPI00288233E0|nr:AraC family ligand binding domain-containing protein [Acidovorax sp. PRC11]MDT0137236.1 AraC family ligand binding domain-containing protein [Acidovorax sp. PRC11]